MAKNHPMNMGKGPKSPKKLLVQGSSANHGDNRGKGKKVASSPGPITMNHPINTRGKRGA